MGRTRRSRRSFIGFFAMPREAWGVLPGLMAIIGFMSTLQEPARASNPRPNIIVILTDDQGFGDTSAHGNPTLKTPHLDRLEGESRSFTNFYVSPTCAPTRSALMTGRHEFFNGVTHTILERERLTREAITLAQVLQSAGYRTGIFGKWHLGDEPEFRPDQRGFDESFIHGGGGIGQTFPGSCGDAPNNSYFDPFVLHNGRFERTRGYCTDVFFQQATRWMDVQRDREPFLCWISTNAPHDPYIASPQDAALYAGLGLSEKLQHFYGMIHNIDNHVGMLLKQLDAWGISENTLVVFMNDNGSAIGASHFNAGLRGAKGSPWLGGTKANSFWRWPKRVRPGKCDALVAHVDLFPTLTAIANAPLTDAIQSQIHGRDLGPLLADPKAVWSDRTLITHVGRWPKGANPDDFKYAQSAIRNTRYTLVSPSGGKEPKWELYDVLNDPGQTLDIAPQSMQVVANLSSEYDRWWDSIRNRLINEQVVGPSENPFKSLFHEQFPTGARAQPNILWIVVEDMSPHFSCYGETSIATPHIDRLAAEGVRFTKAFVTAPICSISRSALITGRYQTSLGVHNHRSSVPGHEIHLPPDAPLVTERFHVGGYHVNNLTVEDFLKSDAALEQDDTVGIAKTDYNFEWEPEKSYAKRHWAHRGKDQPFFVQIQLNGGKFRGQAPLPAWPARVRRELGTATSSDAVRLPPYLPDDPIIREDWAQYLDCIRYTDYQVGLIIERLRHADELDRTVIFFMTDHGISHVRNKQFLYDGGMHVPLIVRGPGIPVGKLRDDLVEHIDLAATSLALAGIEIPKTMHSRDMFASQPFKRRAVFAARDRADETIDCMRAVRTDRFKYIRNGFPNRPYLQPNAYKDSKAIVQTMRRLHAEGKLNTDQSLIMSDSRPLEELYDLQNDPYELHNLSETPELGEQLKYHRELLYAWQKETGDPAQPESEQVYELEAGADHIEGGKGNRSREYRSNLDLMRRWRMEKPFHRMQTD